MSGLAILITSGLIFMALRYASVGKALEQLKIVPITIDITNALKLLIRAQNDSNVDITVTSGKFDVYKGGKHIGEVSIDKRYVIPAKSSAVLALPVRVFLITLIPTLLSVLKKGKKIVFDVKGYVETTAGRYNVVKQVTV